MGLNSEPLDSNSEMIENVAMLHCWRLPRRVAGWGRGWWGHRLNFNGRKLEATIVQLKAKRKWVFFLLLDNPTTKRRPK